MFKLKYVVRALAVLVLVATGYAIWRNLVLGDPAITWLLGGVIGLMLGLFLLWASYADRH